MAEHRVRRRNRISRVVAAIVSLAFVAGCTGEPDEPPVTDGSEAEAEVSVRPSDHRSEPPFVEGVQLEVLDQDVRPPEPSQWSGGEAAIPFGQWWSGLVAGPGIPALWAQPLLLRSDDRGRADLSAPTHTTREDGFRDAAIEPAVFFEFGPDAIIEVVDHGPLHVRFTVETGTADVTLTMVQGSPFLELEGTGTLQLTIPALTGLAASTPEHAVERFSTAAGPWLLASSGASSRTVDGDHVILDLVSGVRHAIGPVAEGADERYDAAAMTAANSPLISTGEQLTVDPDGTVHQVLQQHRSDGTDAVAWSLLPHHEAFVDGTADPIGTIAGVYGQSTVVSASELMLDYPAVPIIWDAVSPPSFDIGDVPVDDVPEIGTGSYFGAKHTATAATQYDVLSAAGADEQAAPYLTAAAESLDALMSSQLDPKITWEPGWGSAVVSPAEFGAGSELNDHQLQNGYWVGAAASVLSADPSRQSLLEDGIDLLVADYAGSSTVPHLAHTVSSEGTWSAFAGHSWASGIGGFAAGNNLESISESSYAWWAAAKWFLATDRSELAEPFIARLTIESWLTGYEWLPTGEHQSTDPAIRPWSGVVWAGKSDPGTWFDPSDEAALGIRLLPLGPQSFSRYHDAAAVEAAGTRWDWCDERGDGCVERWWNLLDSDAAVAGRPELTTGETPEESTTELVRRWWREHWEAASLAEGWSCTPGTTMRSRNDGALFALITNPSPETLAVTCSHADQPTFETVAEARSSVIAQLD